MFQIVLYQPEIPPNTGNIIRLCANTGARLHLIRPLGFTLDDRRLRRAGLDYHEWTCVQKHADFASFLNTVQPRRLYAFTTKATRGYHQVAYQPGDALLFGPETRGLPAALLAQFPADHCLRLPMLTTARSLNLANTVAIALYEAWRQVDFGGAT